MNTDRGKTDWFGLSLCVILAAAILAPFVIQLVYR